MEKDLLKNFEEAKKISDQLIVYARTLVKDGVKILDIAERIEKKTFELGGKPAFPCGVSINEIAAHYTPDIDDKIILKENDLVKIDFGVKVNGCTWDRAFTVCVGNKTHPLIEAAEKALSEAVKLVKAGTKVFEISEVVENTFTEFGFKPVRNLSGHGIDQYIVHSFPSIPNSKNNLRHELKEGMVIAVEVFPTNGVGFVKETVPTLIYRYSADKPVRMYEARKILDAAKIEYERMPFAKRWLSKFGSAFKIDMALKQLLEVNALTEYPTLAEEGKGLVAQAEETNIVK